MEQFDVHLLGYCDSITKALLSKLGWGDEIEFEMKQGDEPWKWLFEGASEVPHEETSDESSIEPDTEDEEEEEEPANEHRHPGHEHHEIVNDESGTQESNQEFNHDWP